MEYVGKLFLKINYANNFDNPNLFWLVLADGIQESLFSLISIFNLIIDILQMDRRREMDRERKEDNEHR